MSVIMKNTAGANTERKEATTTPNKPLSTSTSTETQTSNPLITPFYPDWEKRYDQSQSLALEQTIDPSNPLTSDINTWDSAPLLSPTTVSPNPRFETVWKGLVLLGCAANLGVAGYAARNGASTGRVMECLLGVNLAGVLAVQVVTGWVEPFVFKAVGEDEDV